MDIIKSLVTPLLGAGASNSMIDGMKLVVLGGTVETARRISSSAWSSFVNCTSQCHWLNIVSDASLIAFYLTAIFVRFSLLYYEYTLC
jgi:hypothetical protein